MPISARTFQSAGRISSHWIPGAYSRIDSVRGQSGQVSATNTVIMGRSTGGAPQELLQFNSLNEAVETLRGGPLMEAMRLAFNPGNQVVPQRLFAMRVNNATQATVDLVDGSANDMIQLDSRDYGLYTNQIKVAVAAGSNYGKKVTVTLKSDIETFDDIRRQSFTLTHAADTVTIVNNSGAQTLTTTGGINIDLNAYPTIADLVAYLDAQAGYTAVVVAGQEDASSLELDAVSAQSLAGGYVVQSTFQAIIDTINAQSGLIEATAVNAAEDRVIPENLTEQFLTGGTEGDYDATQWTAALLALEAENIQYIATPDTSASVHASIKTHAETMSSVTKRKERQFLVGAPWGQTVATSITAAGNINSFLGLYVHNGGTQFNVNGVLTQYDAGYVACMLAGMKSALAINEPLTFKSLNLIELEDKLTGSELEQLIEAGVCPINYSSAEIPQIVRQVTTYQTDDLKYNELSMVSIMNFVSRDLRNYLETQFIGKPATAVQGGVLKQAVDVRLRNYTSQGLFQTDADRVSYWNLQVRISGDTVFVDYDAYITAPVNFIFVTQHFHEVIAA